jgi:acyl-coenzyme A synthetase/AMP-(fatty) acid ligase
MAALRGRVDPVFLPRRVVRVDVLPRNPTGKLPEQALAALRARVGEG